MDFEQLIRSWHAQAGSEDYFSKYVFEYLAFIAYLKRIKFTNRVTDSSAIRALKYDAEVRNMYLDLVARDNHLQQSWQSIKNELDERPLGELDKNTDDVHAIWYWDCDCQNVQDQESHFCDQQGRIRNLEDWRNMIEFWHSIRNNLFHGGKNPDDERDQLLIKAGFETLRSLMEEWKHFSDSFRLSIFNTFLPNLKVGESQPLT
ncbi:MAG: hypothetical protein QOE22_700 [Candidatus Parcubacteria bacterium]|jgi:hypothetical protein|nr:hypothetical protein [Candidatus Parcubacteria bacterium]